MWRRMLKSRTLAKENIYWLVGQGGIDAFKDTWLQRTYYSPYSMQAKDMFPNNYPNEALIKTAIGDDAWKEILAKCICLTPLPDAIIWKASSSGKFSTSSAWEITHQRDVKSFFWQNASGPNFAT